MDSVIWFLPPESALGVGVAALFGLQLFALIDAGVRPADSFVAAGKKTKQFWLILLAVVAAATLLLSEATLIFAIAGTVAGLVYVLDVRPAVAAFRRGRGGRASGGRGGW